MTTIAWFVALTVVAIVAGWQGYLVGHDNGHASGSKEGYEEGSMSIKTWAVTAKVTHPGIGMAGAERRSLLGSGLSDLLDLCSRSELIDELMFIVRTVPDDGAERGQWMSRHRRADGPQLAQAVNDDLHL